MTTNEVLKLFPELPRDRLYFWERKKWIYSQRTPRGQKMKGRNYPDSEVRKIRTMLNCYAEGCTPERAYQIASQIELLESNDISRLQELRHTFATASLASDQSSALAIVAKTIRSFINAEAVAIFLRTIVRGAAGTFRLFARDGIVLSDEGPVEVNMHEERRRGLIGYLASRGKPALLSANDLTHHAYSSGSPLKHLKTGQRDSMLFVPLRDRKQDLIGLVTADNFSQPARADQVQGFNNLDLALLSLVAHDVVLLLESVRLRNTMRSLLQAVSRTECLNQFMNHVLEVSISLMRADRGDIAWVENKELIIRALVGNGRRKVGDPLPSTCVMEAVFRTGRHRLIPDVSAEADYYCGNEKTRSEIAVPLIIDGTVEGVLNVESFRPAAFDEEDVITLKHLAAHAALAARIVQASVHRRAIDQEPGWLQQAKNLFERLFHEIVSSSHLKAGLLFVADYTRGMLKCVAARGCPTPWAIEAIEFPFNGPSLPSSVFRARGSHVAAAQCNEEGIGLQACQLFGIRGQIVGVPLVVGSTILGVVVMWREDGGAPRADDVNHLERCANVGLAAISVTRAEQRGRALEQLGRTLASSPVPEDRRSKVREVLRTLIDIGFDRARVFRLDHARKYFVCLGSLGGEPDGEFSGRKIDVTKSPYARQVAEETLPLASAQVRDPHKLILDRGGSHFNKHPDLPWVIAPLIVDRELVGYVAADNSPSRIGIESDTLSWVEQIAGLAAPVILMAELTG